MMIAPFTNQAVAKQAGRSSGARSLMLFSWLQRILPMHLLSRCVGFFARSTLFLVRIPLISSFKAYFKVDLTIAERENVSDYASFNDFFTRALKPGLRIPSGTLSAPADGMVSAAGQVEQGIMLQAKGQSFEIADLLGDANHPFQTGSYITTYLSPKDYHRVTSPVMQSSKRQPISQARFFRSMHKQASTSPDCSPAMSVW